MTRFFARTPFALFLLALLACSSPAPDVAGQEPERPPVAGVDDWVTDFTKATVPLEEIVSGGPPKDGIPAIDAPNFVSVGDADDWLDRREPVAVVRSDGEVKVYPLQILIQHEIVNDVVGETAISVTYCPLCNTTIAFARNFDGRLLDFGTTGRLRHADLVMYDRQTETWWQQATGDGIVGEYAGERLVMVPTNVLSWGSARDRWPDARVLSRETGFARDYGRNPYPLYDRGDGPWAQFFRFGRKDERLRAMERVVALEHVGSYLAVPFSELADARVANVSVGGRERVVFWAPGTSSAVDARDLAEGRDVGSSTVFEPVVNGIVLTFEPAGDGFFRDTRTGSVWDLTGRAISGGFEGSQLDEVVHGNHFWFAWGTFRPETEVWRAR